MNDSEPQEAKTLIKMLKEKSNYQSTLHLPLREKENNECNIIKSVVILSITDIR